MRVAVAQGIEHLIDYEGGRGFDSHQSLAHQMAPELVTGGHFLEISRMPIPNLIGLKSSGE